MEDEDKPIRLGKDEMNLIENPIALLADAPEPDLKELRYTLPVPGKDGKVTQSTWVVTGSETYGLPIAGDEDIYLILMELTKEQGFKERTVYFSRYEIVRRLKGADGKMSGSDYERVSAALNRLVGVTVYATRWYDKGIKKNVAIGFHILEKVVVADETPGRKRAHQPPLRMSYVTWDETIFKNFQAGYIKNLDLDRYFRLKSPIARRLYRLLDKRFYDGKPKFETNLRLLAFEHLGLSRAIEYDSHLKARMKKAHEELVANSCISGYDFRQGKEGLVVVYYPPKRYVPDLDGECEIEPLVVGPERGEESADLLSQLLQAGVSGNVAERLVRECPEERVREKLAFLPFARPRPRNPGGWIRRAIEQDWAAPPEYLRARREEEKSRQPKRPVRPRGNGDEKALDEALSALSEGELTSLRARAEASVRERFKKPAELFDRGKGVRAWEKLVRGEMARVLLSERPEADLGNMP